jgi:hypothetical protein
MTCHKDANTSYVTSKMCTTTPGSIHGIILGELFSSHACMLPAILLVILFEGVSSSVTAAWAGGKDRGHRSKAVGGSFRIDEFGASAKVILVMNSFI